MLELLAWDYRGVIQDILIVALIVVAIVSGGAPERAAIAIWCVCFELPTLVYRDIIGLDFRLTGVDTFLAAKDIAAGMLWVALALYANRNYPLWIAGVQLLAIGAHMAQGLIDSISPVGFMVLVVAPGWLQLCAMGIGFTRHILRKRKYGQYRDWRIVRKPPDFGPIAQTRKATFPLGANSDGPAKDKAP
ncbi:MAG: hypothetical protein AAF687_03230 [Pseudomonadota bacterium]